MRFRLASLFALGLLAAAPLEAQYIDGRVSGVPGVTLDFNALGVASFTPVGAVGGVAFANAYFVAPDALSTPFTTGALYNIPPDGFSFGVLSIRFGTVVQAAAFNLAVVTGSTTFSAWLGGTFVSEFVSTSGGSSPSLFFGFEGIAFDQIDIRHIQVQNVDQIAFTGVDNLQFAPSVVPEPASLPLMLGALGVLVTFSRRRRTR